MLFISTNGFYFPATVITTSGRSVTSHNTGTNTDHVDFSTNGLTKKTAPYVVGRTKVGLSCTRRSRLRSSLDSVLWSYFKTASSYGNFSKISWRSSVMAHWQRLLMIRLNTLENFTVSGSQQRSTAWVLCLAECLFLLSLEVPSIRFLCNILCFQVLCLRESLKSIASSSCAFDEFYIWSRGDKWREAHVSFRARYHILIAS